MPFDRIFLDELSARNDIVEIVSQYVQLKKSGANYFGLCPFHNEKTGSFSVSPDKQIFHCFGCGAGGGVITFIMKAEGLTFPDAVRYLAERAGMQIPEQGEAERKAARHRERLYALCRDAGRYYYDTLWRPENRTAQHRHDTVNQHGKKDLQCRRNHFCAKNLIGRLRNKKQHITLFGL